MAAEAPQDADFDDSPRGWARRWQTELQHARKEVEKWHTQGARIDKRFRDERDSTEEGDTRINLFTSNVETKMATLYGQTPKVSVSRRFADANDDVARVAAEMLERLLNSDIEKDSDTFAQALQYALEDRLLPGLGLVRVRYVAEFETVPETPAILAPDGVTELAPAVPAEQRKVYECVDTDYVHWRDVLWSPARVWHEVEWLAFSAEMGEREFNARFDADGKQLLWRNVPKCTRRDDDDKTKSRPWDRVRVWEVWDKPTRRVFWVVEGYPQTLDEKDDPLGLEGFWPCPRPLLANATTSKLLPRPDFVLAQDLYNQIDEVSTRINLLVAAVRAVGAYDKSNGALPQMLDGTKTNKMVPVDNWAVFGEKGGIRGAVDWFPLDQVVGAIAALREERRELKENLFEVTGMADVMRGASDPTETARAQGIKARFGSVRLQQLQEAFARFASDVQRLKAEIIAKHYDVATMLAASNVQYGFDAETAAQAAELLKSRYAEYRVEVKPEAVNLVDMAALKQERSEVLVSIASFLQAVLPMAQQSPQSLPYLLEMLKWSVSGLRGSSTIEGVLDRAIAAAQEAQKQPPEGKPTPPDPKVLAQQLKGQQDLVKIDAELRADLTRTQAEVEADRQREQNQAVANVREAAAKQQISAANRVANPGSPFGGNS